MLILIATFALTANAEDRPNILWLTSEDNNVTHIGCYGNEYAVTPNIDKLAEEGFRFTQCYSNGAVCSASRSTWITGMISVSTGAHNHRSKVAIPKEVTLYPQALQAAGYYTANYYKTDYNITNRKTVWNGSAPKWSALKQKQPFFQVINFADSHESRAMGTSHIHDPAKVKIPPYHPDIPGVHDNYAHYYDAVTRMDNKIGKAIKSLEDAGLADNTIIIYNSDHGGPLPRGKRYMYNSGTHCPLVIRIPEKYKHLWPAKTPGMTVDRLVSFVDMPATWLALAGAKIPANYHGRIFLGPNKQPEARYHFSFRGRNDERVENARSIRDKRFLYVKNYIPYVPRGQHLTFQWRVPMQRFLEQHHKEGKTNAAQSRFFQTKAQHELYDTAKDPFCMNDLAKSPEFKNMLVKMNKALNKEQGRLYDAGLIPESEINKRAKDAGLTVYETIRKKELYNLTAYQEAAELALAKSQENSGRLTTLCEHSDNGVRYWAATGLMMLGEGASPAKSQLTNLLKDESHNVRIMAAWALIKLGDKQKAEASVRKMLASGSYAMMEILNTISWMGNDGKVFLEDVVQVKSNDHMINWMKAVIFQGTKYEKAKGKKNKSKGKNKRQSKK